MKCFWCYKENAEWLVHDVEQDTTLSCCSEHIKHCVAGNSRVFEVVQVDASGPVVPGLLAQALEQFDKYDEALMRKG